MYFQQEIDKHFSDISRVAQYLWEKGWAEASAGNFSIGLGRTDLSQNYLFTETSTVDLKTSYPALAGHSFLISGSGSRMRDVAQDPKEHSLLLHIAEDTQKAHCYHHHTCQSKPKASSELDVHLHLHVCNLEQNRPENCVLHAHVSEVIALTQLEEIRSEENINKLLAAIHPEFRLFIPEGVALIPYMESGTLDIAKKTIELSRGKRSMIWEKHGMICFEKDLNSAFDLMDIVAKQAAIYLKLHA
jgi:rhamnulose-1-phosphate aldolase